MGYWINYKQSDRQPRDDDKEKFERFARVLTNQINWYSFKPQDAQNGELISIDKPLKTKMLLTKIFIDVLLYPVAQV